MISLVFDLWIGPCAAGVEVKPGKKVTHSCEKARGRLRISQVLSFFNNMKPDHSHSSEEKVTEFY